MNKILIDTQSFIWFMEDNKHLPASMRTLMNDSGYQLTISMACLWEMTIKMSLSKLALSADIATIMSEAQANGFEFLFIEPAHLVTLSTLAPIHRDPFDRIMIAQAITENMPIISSDKVFEQYPVNRLWT
ncbi:MAG: type II toxin-antitoxin system VapC family toxin [Prevotellaceae bacterium]|jgi:PIN domain nuclease of toxin-antitoxin system|nr:type II toxin-antitoxin system VapC family toxin [Prevotellaceae bacterium]